MRNFLTYNILRIKMSINTLVSLVVTVVMDFTYSKN